MSNYEIADYAAANSDICIPFASIDPRKGRLGVREARDLVENHGVRGFKFHGIMQDIGGADRIAYPIYEAIAEHKLPAIFHTGHSGMCTGMRGGGGVRLKWGQPMPMDDVAVDFPDMVDRMFSELEVAARYPRQVAWREAMTARPAVQRALAAEDRTAPGLGTWTVHAR